MADTHINAYFTDVEDKQKAFDQASAALDAAEAALEAKKKQVGWVDSEPTEETSTEDNHTAPSEEPRVGNIFNKKK